MKNANIWFITDNSVTKKIAELMDTLGLRSIICSDFDQISDKIKNNELNLFVIDIKGSPIESVITKMNAIDILHNFMKFLVVDVMDVKKCCELTDNCLHLEVIERPLRHRELMLILEKSVIVEKYRDTMKDISLEAEERIEAFESLVHIQKKDMFHDETETEVFQRIVNFEKTMLSEQNKLNDAIKKFSESKQKELFEVKNILLAEQMVEQLRQKELMDANETIRAQEAVLEYSSKELKERENILSAHELNVELSREEAISLHHRIRELENENSALKSELQQIKGK